MYIVTLEDHPEGVFSVFDETDERVIPIFQEEDDAERYLQMLHYEEDYPRMQIVEMEDHVIIGVCQEKLQPFTIITPDDLLIPPDETEE